MSLGAWVGGQVDGWERASKRDGGWVGGRENGWAGKWMSGR